MFRNRWVQPPVARHLFGRSSLYILVAREPCQGNSTLCALSGRSKTQPHCAQKTLARGREQALIYECIHNTRLSPVAKQLYAPKASLHLFRLMLSFSNKLGFPTFYTFAFVVLLKSSLYFYSMRLPHHGS
jgi:hypothetical protein